MTDIYTNYEQPIAPEQIEHAGHSGTSPTVLEQNQPTSTDLRFAGAGPVTGLPGLEIGDNTGSHSFVSAQADGPVFRTERQLTGDVQVREPAQPGNPEQVLDLIRSNGFQNPNGTLSAAGAEAIRAAVANTGLFQTYEQRAAEVARYINQRTNGNVSIQFDRDTANASTLQGSRPFIRATVGGATTNIPMRR